MVDLQVGVEFQPDPALKRVFQIYFLTVLLIGFLSWILPIVVYVLLVEPVYAAFLVLPLLPLLIVSLFTLYWIPRYQQSITYLLTDQEIIVTGGVWFRSKKFVPYNRITNIETHQGPLSRLFNLGTTSIQTAGYSGTSSSTGKSAEAQISYIRNFDEVKDMVRAYIGQTKPVAVEAGKEPLQRISGVDEQILSELKKIRVALEK
jgi:membrane protein YdbS with pleckstrin-like domain